MPLMLTTEVAVLAVEVKLTSATFTTPSTAIFAYPLNGDPEPVAMATPHPSHRQPGDVASLPVALKCNPVGPTPPKEGPPSTLRCPWSLTPSVTVPFVMIAPALASTGPKKDSKAAVATKRRTRTILVSDGMMWNPLAARVY